MTDIENSNEVRIVIIGAGFAGLCMAINLLKQGEKNFVVVERADGIGGVWRDNVYPGAACDIPAVLYSYSFEQDYPWTQAYPQQKEILGYMSHIVCKYNLADHLRFGVNVCNADFKESTAKWTVGLADGNRLSCDILIPAIGIFNHPVTPSIEGISEFKGPVLHSARWPQNAVFEDQRVAVIGTGASAIQIVPELAKHAKELTVYQRSAPYVLPKATINMSDTSSERARVFAELEKVALSRSDFAMTAKAQSAFLAYLTDQVPDPVLRSKLTPSYILGCKRTLFSDHWYPALQRGNVHLETEPIRKISSNAILLNDGTKRQVDCIVFATGFNPSNYLQGIKVVGSKNTHLSDTWSQGAEAYLGIAVAGFPNMFLMYGPNTNVAGSIIYMLECQAEFIVKALALMKNKAAKSMEVSPLSYREYCDSMQDKLSDSTITAANCQSYSMNAAGRVVTNYPGTSLDYRHATESVDSACFHLSLESAIHAVQHGVVNTP